MGPVLGRLFSTIKMRAFAFVLLAAASEVSWLVLTTPTVLLAVLVPSVTVPTPDMLATLVLDTLATLTMLLLPPLPTPELFLLPLSTPVLSQPPPSTDTPDTSMASVRLTLMLMPTPSDRSLLDSQSTTPMLPDTPTMLELLPELLTPLPSTLDTPTMLLPPTPLDMLDILAMLV